MNLKDKLEEELNKPCPKHINYFTFATWKNRFYKNSLNDMKIEEILLKLKKIKKIITEI